MWYAASLFFKSIHETEVEVPSLWEEIIVLVEADSQSEAKTVAEGIGRSKEHAYYVSNPHTHLLRWSFVQVERIHSLKTDEWSSGVEVFSRFLRQSEAESLLTPLDDEPPRK